ncbi:MAG: M23 family metallopeptidase [Chitinispirillaceae bacterium]|nr:M23 family metallopeptidase [Chitinispirillaceae bacterium]
MNIIIGSGGNYIWALHPPGNLLLYFAHLDSIVVVPGQIRRAGDTLATLGRTGKNAASARSPTHLHLMALEADGDSIKSVDWWDLVH